ncbi:MAG: hypothetical protein GF320_06450 [Armatimonadia bacterium]|nr:hypothetical protein [Armatimonadia bacterium]
MTFAVLLPLVAAASFGSTDDIVLTPYLQNPAPDAITVMWETATPTTGSVTYAPGLGQMYSGSARTIEESRPTTIHQVRLTGLAPGAEYYYSVRCGSYRSEPKRLRTVPGPSVDAARFIIYGDSRSQPDIHGAVASLFDRHGGELIINSGDLVGAGSDEAQWKPQFFDPLADVIDEVPIVTVAGNHEQESPHYYGRVDLPGNERWFSMDYAGVHIIGLNSCLPGDQASDQYRWLVSDLRSEAARRANWIIVAFHHPPFSSHPTRGVFGLRDLWHKTFERHGVDFVFNGHDHYYQRTKWIEGADGDPSTGVVYFVTGGGGAPTYPTEAKAYTACDESVHHYMVVDFKPSSMRFETYDIDGRLIDSGIYHKGTEYESGRFHIGAL